MKKLQISLAAIAAASMAPLVSAQTTYEVSKTSIVEAVNAVISKKSKPWSDLALDPQSKNYTYWQNCRTLKAVHCHTYELSHRKVKGRVSSVVRTFDKACRDAGGLTVGGSNPAYGNIKNFFFENHSVVKRAHIPVVSQHLVCELDQNPAVSIFTDSAQATRLGNGNLVSKEALYEKPRIYIYISDLQALAPDLEQEGRGTKRKEQISKACMDAPLKLGDRTQFGLVTNVRGPLIEIQRERGPEWVRAEEVQRDIRECEAD